MGYFLRVTDKEGGVIPDVDGSELQGATTYMSTICSKIIQMGLKDGEYAVFKDVTAEAKELLENGSVKDWSGREYKP